MQGRECITIWDDTEINPGSQVEEEIEKHLEAAQIILLLVSTDFIVSNSKEIKRVLELHEQKKVKVIPILLRPCHWEEEPFSQFRVLPENKEPVTAWQNKDQAYKNVVGGINKVIKEINKDERITTQTLPELLNETSPSLLEERRHKESRTKSLAFSIIIGVSVVVIFLIWGTSHQKGFLISNSTPNPTISSTQNTQTANCGSSIRNPDQSSITRTIDVQTGCVGILIANSGDVDNGKQHIPADEGGLVALPPGKHVISFTNGEIFFSPDSQANFRFCTVYTDTRNQQEALKYVWPLANWKSC